MTIDSYEQKDTLTKENIWSYGGFSRIYKLPDEKNCLKVYREMISLEKRNLIRDNYINLSKVKSLENNQEFLTPLKLLVDSENGLQACEFPFLPYPNMWAEKRNSYMTKRYLNILLNMIKIVKKLTNKGIIITDLKLSNMLVSPSGQVIIIDNDFSIRVSNTQLLNDVANFSKNIYKKNYFEKFKDYYDEDYNRYMLINMMALLLIENSSLDKVWPLGSSPSMNTLIEINRIIQKDNEISSSLKKILKNTLTATMSPSISDYIIEDYQETILRKIKSTK